MDKEVPSGHPKTQEISPDKTASPDSPRPSDVDGVRRRLLRLTAYAAPFLLTFGLPEAGRAAKKTACPKACRCGSRCGRLQ